MNIKIFKVNKSFYFAKNNYLVAVLAETNDRIVFYEYDWTNISADLAGFHDRDHVDLYEFIFSDDSNRLFLNRTKPVTYRGTMKTAIQIDKELKEYFKNLIEKED